MPASSARKPKDNRVDIIEIIHQQEEKKIGKSKFAPSLADLSKKISTSSVSTESGSAENVSASKKNSNPYE